MDRIWGNTNGDINEDISVVNQVYIEIFRNRRIKIQVFLMRIGTRGDKNFEKH